MSYAFRRAGELVAWVREEGNYLTWYCSGEPGYVAGWIEEALAEAGWAWAPLDSVIVDRGEMPEEVQRLA